MGRMKQGAGENRAPKYEIDYVQMVGGGGGEEGEDHGGGAGEMEGARIRERETSCKREQSAKKYNRLCADGWRGGGGGGGRSCGRTG